MPFHISKIKTLVTSKRTLNAFQTIGIIATLITTLVFGIHGEQSKGNPDSTDFMLKFDEHLNSGLSGVITKTLE